LNQVLKTFPVFCHHMQKSSNHLLCACGGRRLEKYCGWRPGSEFTELTILTAEDCIASLCSRGGGLLRAVSCMRDSC
jgi:hypothetical protein